MTGFVIGTTVAGGDAGSLPWLWIILAVAGVAIGLTLWYLLRAGAELDSLITLEIIKGERSGESIAIGSSFTTLGADKDNDVVIGDDKISRHHARLRYQKGSLTITDVNSLFGTFLNGARVEESECADGDRIGLGSVFECQVRIPPA